MAGLCCGGAGAAEVNADLFFVPHDKIVIDDNFPGLPAFRSGGEEGAAFRIESLPESRHGWTLHAEHQAVNGKGESRDAEETRLGIGGQLGRAQFRVALYAEYLRLDLDEGDLEGAGFQVRFNFRHLDPVFVNLQLGHQCLEGAVLYGSTVDNDEAFDLAEVTLDIGYRMSEHWFVLAEGRRRWEVVDPGTVDFDGSTMRLGLRMSY